ncbi:MAG: NAD(P)/FAD-dependent oxidoreductase [Bacteroidetes bacterium]|nr:NAD(P)/FAD-dependent oxidoreductase [Bacteroidota bacterium]
MHIDEYHDIVIAGAGPAGISASLFLSQSNVKHLIIDKAVFPRDKICGDALSGKVFSHLKHVIPEIHQDFDNDPKHYIPSYGVRFVAPNGKNLDVPFSPGLTMADKSPGFISKRIDFDYYLFEKCKKSENATVYENCELVKLLNIDEGLYLTLNKEGKEITIFTKLLISAEGERSPTSKMVYQESSKDRDSFSAGIRAYYSGVTDFQSMNFIELHFIKDFLPGYFWIFPLPNGQANVGVGMLSKDVSKKKLNLKKMMEQIIEHHPEISKRFTSAKLESKILGWGLPLGRKQKDISTDRILLCGDAASLIDPFTGEGIGNAALSGRYAAQTAVKAIQNNNFSSDFLKEYDEIVFKKIGGELKLSSTLLSLCRYPKLFNMVVNKANRNKELSELISCMFADIGLRKKFSNPLFYLKILFS